MGEALAILARASPALSLGETIPYDPSTVTHTSPSGSRRHADRRLPFVLAMISAILASGAVAARSPAAAAPDPRPTSAQTVQEGEPADGQVDLFDLIAKLRGADDAPAEGPPDAEDDDARLFIFPAVGGSPSVGLAVGALATITDYFGEPGETDLSSILISASVTTRKQILVVARSDLSTRENRWRLLGDWRLYKFTERTHGLGSDTSDRTAADVDYDWYRLHQTAYTPLWGDLQMGGGYHLDIHRGIQLATEQPPEPLSSSQATRFDATTSSGVSLDVLFDTRDNPLNPDRGLYGRAGYTFYREGLGGNSDWENLQLEARAYRRLPTARRQTLGVWGIGWFTQAGEPPYFDLPSLGWDTYGRTGRGYRAGRFRGRDWIYGEVEYRTDITRNGLFGAVGFFNASSFSDSDTQRFQRWVFGGGLGARIKLDKERRSNVSVDVGWGREGSLGLFLAINEAF